MLSLAAAALFAVPLAAQSAGFCSGGGATEGISVDDMTFGVLGSTPDPADDCYGVVADNDTAANVFPDGGDAWTFLAKDDDPGSVPQGSGSIGDITFTLTADAGTAGSWTLSWIDSDPGTPPNFPLTLDLLGVLKAGSEFASYLFEAETLTAANSPGSGAFDIVFTNQGGSNPDLSHLSVYYRDSGGGGGGQIPEPATLGLLGLGLAALGAIRRRSR
jgi:hypothetical protein